jgi:integrase
MNAASRGRRPTTVKRTVRPGRLPNNHYRVREYLTEREVERLMKAAASNRYGHRDATMILVAFRHGLRASELASLRWEQIDLVHARLHVARLKNGIYLLGSPIDRQRTSGTASPSARASARPLRLHERARSTHERGGLPQNDHEAGEGCQDAV